MLLALWSPKGGSGTSIVAAACAVVLARHCGARLVDLDGDQPAIFGLAAEPDIGILDWLALGPEAPTDALTRVALHAAPGLALIPRGVERTLAPVASAEAGAALAVALRDDGLSAIADLGTARTPATRAVGEVADASIIVVRGCYLALRRAVHAPLLEHTTGVVLLEEPGRSLGAGEIAEVLGRPVLATMPVRESIARAVDAGVITSRLPEPLARPAARLLGRIQMLAGPRGAVA